MIGKTLAHYEITSQLGKGGMGEVYQAKDSKLGRDVAIKVLPDEFALDADRVARFQREAKLLASLNHPNIAAIYGLEEANGTNFLVMELIEGDTLADRIKTGPIPVEEALKLALQIAEALEAAHEKGVVHRDLKPANIKVTSGEKVKILDFGLAKAFAEDQGEMKPQDSPTLSAAATRQGIILGTAAYMSPEQARGKSVDRRADVWAFGVILFEMLTGRALFEGEDVTSTLARVLEREPDYSALNPNLHPRIRFLLERCLEKDPVNRYSSISDVRVEIQKVLADPGGVFVQPIIAAKPRKRLRLSLPWIAAVFIIGLIIAGVSVWKLKPREPRQVIRFDYNLPDGQQFSNLNYPALAISHDGKRIVYSSPKGLYLRFISESSSKLISGTEGSTSQPFFSPDDKWIGYLSLPDLELKKININGGAPVALCGASPAGVNWESDDTIVYGMSPGDIMSVSANGGTPEPFVNVKTGIGAYPQMLPDGESILYTTTALQPTVVVQSIKTGERKELFAGIAARYVPTGHIIYGLPNNNNLFAIPFDLDKLETTGGAVPIVEGVISPIHCAVSDSGILVYLPGTVATSNQRTLVWVDQKGKEEPLPIQPGDYKTPKISPDGKKIALTIANGEKSDIWIWDIARETMTRLTFNESSLYPLWNQESSRIAFMRVTGSELAGDVYWKAADGTGNDEKITSVFNRALLPWSWSKDGKTLALFEADFSGGINYDIGMLSMEGNHERKPLLNQKYIEFQPKISPGGKWMAYASDESGQLQIYVRPFPEVNSGRWQISATGGAGTPLWSPDGRELYYLAGDTAMRVSVETEPTFKAGKPEILFKGRYVQLSTNDGQPWDINPDGKRFLMLKPYTSGEDSSSVSAEKPKINVVLNWFEELKQRVPVE